MAGSRFSLIGYPVMAYPVLRKRSEFLAVADSRKKAAMPGLLLQIRPHSASDTNIAPVRVGYTASRKVGNAVTRNRAKRRLRALVARIFPDYAQPGFDYVLIARAETPTRQFDLLQSDLVAAMRRTGACRQQSSSAAVKRAQETEGTGG